MLFVEVVRRFARLGDRVDETVAAQQRVVERRRERGGRGVVHGPSGGDDAADADLDQLLGDARREAQRDRNACGVSGPSS